MTSGTTRKSVNATWEQLLAHNENQREMWVRIHGSATRRVPGDFNIDHTIIIMLILFLISRRDS